MNPDMNMGSNKMSKVFRANAAPGGKIKQKKRKFEKRWDGKGVCARENAHLPTKMTESQTVLLSHRPAYFHLWCCDILF